MNKRNYLFFVAICATLCLTSCGDKYYYKHIVHWTCCVQGSDALVIDYPKTLYNDQGYPIPSSQKIDFNTIDVHGDTTIYGRNTTKDWQDFTNVEVRVARQTNHDAVRVMFIRTELLPNNFHIPHSNTETNPYLTINQQALDSMMNIYGVTLPSDQDQITVPITINKK